MENIENSNNIPEVTFMGQHSINNVNPNKNEHCAIKNINNIPLSNDLSSCKILQRKLELKVERAKRNYSQLNNQTTSVWKN